jgi:hypothetical protein
VVELADTPDLGSGSARIGGSSPLARTTFTSENEVSLLMVPRKDECKNTKTQNIAYLRLRIIKCKETVSGIFEFFGLRKSSTNSRRPNARQLAEFFNLVRDATDVHPKFSVAGAGKTVAASSFFLRQYLLAVSTPVLAVERPKIVARAKIRAFQIRRAKRRP